MIQYRCREGKAQGAMPSIDPPDQAQVMEMQPNSLEKPPASRKSWRG